MRPARILKPEEWSRVESLDLGAMLPYVAPENIAIVVVEDDAGNVVGCVSALQVTHFEGLWIAPEYRGNAGVSRALMRQLYAIPRIRGESWAIGGSTDGRMRSLCGRLGGKPLPVEFFALPVGEC